MPETMTCTCGARLRLPEDAAGKTFRCPSCSASVTVPAAEEALPVVVLPAAEPAAPRPPVCPICQTVLHESDETHACPLCQQVHHRPCWDEVGGCSTYGCENAPKVEKAETAPDRRTGWGDSKRCPRCRARIKSVALRCRYCGEEFGTVDPMTPADLRRRDQARSELTGLKTAVIICFAATLIGCLAPITLMVGLFYFLPRRQQLAKAGPIFQILAYATIGLAAVYSLLLIPVFVWSMATEDRSAPKPQPRGGYQQDW